MMMMMKNVPVWEQTHKKRSKKKDVSYMSEFWRVGAVVIGPGGRTCQPTAAQFAYGAKWARISDSVHSRNGMRR